MKRHLSVCLRRASLFAGVIACALISASSAYSATFSYSSVVSTAAGTYLGGPGFYTPYTASNNTATLPTSSLLLLNLGSFMTLPSNQAPNGNVTSTFTLSINTVGVPNVSSVSFTGSIVADGAGYDINFSPTKPYYWAADPNGGATFDIQNVGTCAPSLAGCYTVGIEPIKLNSGGKTTNLWAFIGPANLTTPEPSTATTMALAGLVLVMFAMRRKVQTQRS